MESVLVEDEKLYESGNFHSKTRDGVDVMDIDSRDKEEHTAGSLTENQKNSIVAFTAIFILVEIAIIAFIQLLGIYKYGTNVINAVTTKVGWSAYSSGLGVGFALLIAVVALYARMQRVSLNAWPGFESVMSKVCAAMLVETPLLGQVNTYTAMCKGLGAGVGNASLVGTKISEALVSTICGYGAFSVLLVVYMFTLSRKDQNNEGA